MKPIESKRVPLDRKIVLRFSDFDGFVTEFAANLSMTGMFVRSQEPQESGTPVSFELRLEDGAPLVRGSGWVVWARHTQEAPDRPAGMGIEFTELDHKSRRLVRWMITSQSPEGSAPYNVRAEEQSGSGAARTRLRTGPRPLGWTIASVVLLLGGVAGWFWWPAQPKAGSSHETLARESPNAATKPDPGEGAMPAAVAPVANEPLADRLDDDREAAASAAAVEAVVRDWAEAWSDQDIDRYLAQYASDFTPADGLSRGQWSEQRRRRVSAPDSIRVAVTRLETRIQPDGSARASFLQTYRSDGYADTVDKVLELVLEDGVWKIRRESAD